jgi:hypothetical protein
MSLGDLLGCMDDVMAATERPQSRYKRLFTIEDAGEYLGRTPWAVRHLIWNGVLLSVRIGNRVQVDINDMDNLIDGHKTVAR